MTATVPNSIVPGGWAKPPPGMITWRAIAASLGQEARHDADVRTEAGIGYGLWFRPGKAAGELWHRMGRPQTAARRAPGSR
jgi:hypothetical protein